MTEETLHKFPCEFPIKVFGHATPQFEIDVYHTIRQHVPELSETAIQNRNSKQGKYLAITVTFTATSKAQLDQIYLALNALTSVVMVL